VRRMRLLELVGEQPAARRDEMRKSGALS